MDDKYGLLINQNAKLHRAYFTEMVKLHGVQAMYQSPLNNGHYTLNGEYTSNNYTEPIKVGVIFEEHVTQRTAKKLGWISELSEKAAIIHVPYDLPGLQIGCLFEIPSAYDNTPGRVFRIVKMSATMIYPASISCEIVPEYTNTAQMAEMIDFTMSDFNLLNEE